MPRYVAFLRAINVGGRVVKMEALRSTFEELGFTGVETYWLCVKGVGGSKIPNGLFERTLKAKATFRGVRTMEKLAAKYPD